jgi:hypothetical protein
MVAAGQVLGQSIHQTAAGIEASMQHNGDDHPEFRKLRRRRKQETDPREDQEKLPWIGTAPARNLKKKRKRCHAAQNPATMIDARAGP